jgi:N-acetylmuramoyl-L-alanine amidase
MITRPSPNFGPRPDGVPIDMIVLHYTGMPSAKAALERLCDPAAEVSAHYLIDEDGTIHQLVADEQRAWHAGLSYWRGERDVNSRSLGIELVNPGHEFGYRPFPGAQIAALTALLHALMGRHGIAARNLVGHADVAPARKQDPGELFPWEALAREGLGLWSTPGTASAMDESATRALLTAYGYDPDCALDQVLAAFQRHFRPARIDGIADGETLGLLSRLNAVCGLAT